MKETTLSFDRAIFSQEALLNTGYWCADRAVMVLTQRDEQSWEVRLTAREGELPQTLIDDFQTMAVHNQIRHNLRSAFQQLETTIVERAFRPVKRPS